MQCRVPVQDFLISCSFALIQFSALVHLIVQFRCLFIACEVDRVMDEGEIAWAFFTRIHLGEGGLCGDGTRAGRTELQKGGKMGVLESDFGGGGGEEI